MERYVNILLGLLVIAGVVVMVVKRPIAPRLSRWLSAHRTLVETVVPFIFITWGAAIWALIIAKSAFGNVLAMVAGSLLICTGVFFFFKRG